MIVAAAGNFDFIAEFRFTAIRGNVSEILALAAGGTSTRGVDASVAALTPPSRTP